MRNQRGNSRFRDDDRTGAEATDTMRHLPSSDTEQVFFHFDFVRSLQMHRKLAVGILLGSVLLSLGYMARRWKTYKGESLVYVQPSPRRVLESGPGQQWPYDANTYESYIQQQVHDVTRPDVLAGAVKRLPGWQGSSESEQAAADRLGSAVEVTRVGTAYEVSIVATAGSRVEAAQIANAVAQSFIDSATRQERAGDPQRIELLRDERDRIQKELTADRAEQDDLSRKLGVASVGGTAADPIDQQIGETRSELVKAKTDNDQAAAKLTALAGGKESNAALDAEADALVAADPGLVSMKTSLNARRSLLISQMANLTPNHPQYKQDADELAKINTSLDQMTGELRSKASAQIEQRLKNDLERTSSVEARLNGQLATLTGAAGSAAPRLQRTSELTTDIQRLQARFSVVDEQYRNLTMENNAPGAVYLASAALPPLHAARTKVFRNAFILLLAGLVFALGGALVAHNFDPRVYTAGDVERVLGFPPMAQIPDLLEVGSGVAEEYMLRLAAAVEHAHQQGLLSSCIFTGVAAGAGASTVSKRVSGLLEAMGRETVLVDAVGTPAPNAGNLNAGTDMVCAPRGSRSTALLQQMSEETDEDTVVLTDTAPLQVSGETEYLARFVDSAIVIIESGVTTKAQLREVAKTLHRLDVSSVGFVLNRIALVNADAAFQQSVHAVEAHLHSQARAFERAVAAQKENEQQNAVAPSPATPAPPPTPLSMDRLMSVVAPPPAIVAPSSPTPRPAQPEPPRRAPEPDRAAQIIAEVAAAEAATRAARVPSQEAPRRPSPDVASRPAVRVEIAERTQAPAPSRVSAQQPATPASPPPPPAQIKASAPEHAPAQSTSVVRQQYGAATAIETEMRPQPSEFTGRSLRGREPVRTSPDDDLRATFQPSMIQSQLPSREAVTDPRNQPGGEFRVTDASSVSQASLTAAAQATAAENGRRRVSGWVDLMEPDQSPAMHPHSVPPASARPEPARQAAALESHAGSASPSTALALMTSASESFDEPPYSAASRLGGLRNLMTSLGIKNLHKEAEYRRGTSDLEPASERQGERPVFAQEVDPADSSSGHATLQSAAVVAAPEIIPPRLTSEVTVERDRDREKERETAHRVKSPRLSRWDMADDVETLPSKRGQYRKRH
ncbi:MAG TPA: hypothetical protein VGJ21_00350 [Terracidiphilus sp.]|jgi:uncharacterized protein involved in exopolysaccharide biosynthesis